MARYHGKGGVVYLSVTGAGNATTVATLTSWALNQPTTKDNVTGFGDTNQQYVQGLPDCTGRFAGYWDDTDDNLYDASRSADGVKIYLYPTNLVAGKYWHGTAWIDFSIECPVDGKINVTADWSAKGNWGQA